MTLNWGFIATCEVIVVGSSYDDVIPTSIDWDPTITLTVAASEDAKPEPIVDKTELVVDKQTEATSPVVENPKTGDR